MVKIPKTTAYSGMFHFALWRLAWLATCCLLVCSVDAQPCEAGFSSSNGGICTRCVAGKYSIGIGNAACTECEEGKFSAELGSISNVCVCNAGYTGADDGACAPCGIDTFKNATGNATCLSCPINSQSPAPGVPRDRCLCNAGFTGPTVARAHCAWPASSSRSRARQRARSVQ